MFEFAWLILAAPLVGALVNLGFGSHFSKRTIGAIASGVVVVAFAMSLWLFVSLLGLAEHDRSITVHLWDWITIGGFYAPAALLIDPLSITMALVVTGVGSLIHIYATSYMHDDERFQRFFVYLNFFVFAMLILVMSDNFVGMFVGWEGVGLASYLLIGFWFDRSDETYGSYADAGKKAFLVNRVGDVGMILAVAMIWVTLGTVVFGEVFEAAEHSLALGAANIICLLLLLAATGKSAQLPLFVWLPDAMAGPTPVSALIHAATMVTAGVYMIARTHPLWHIGVDAATLAAWIGGLTALMAATIALVQVDLKKILAFSTISQLGYMIMGVGVGAYGAAIFHLTAHAFFKALLFLAAGSVMHGLHGELDIRKMGGLRDKMPTTFRTYLIGAAALAGIPLMAGFFSKDAILLGTLAKSPALYVVGLVTALLTAVYSFRSVFVPFYGKPRDQELYDHAHESPRTMTIPLWILAFLSIFGGLLNLPFIVSMEHWLEPAIGHHDAPSLTLELTAITLSVVVALFGFVIAFARYRRHEGWAMRIENGFQFLRPAIDKEWYLDRFYNRWIVRPLWSMSAWFAAVLDKKVIDGVVNGVGRLNLFLGERVRHLENGLVPTYALSIFVGVTAIVAYIVFSAL